VGTRLDETQKLFGRAFAQFDSLIDNTEFGEAVDELAAGNERLTPRQQADIYREQFWLRHRDVLYDDYPALSYVLGEEAFEDLCRGYLVAHPPSSYTLRDLGHAMPQYASRHDKYASDAIKAAAIDVARFEHSFVDVFDGEHREPLAADLASALAPEDWAKATIVLHPLLKLMEFQHAVYAARNAACDHGDIRHGSELPEDRLPKAARTQMAIWRGDELKIIYRTMDHGAFELARALQAGTRLVEACDEAADQLSAQDREQFAAKLGGWFRLWGNRGWIVDVSIDGRSITE